MDELYAEIEKNRKRAVELHKMITILPEIYRNFKTADLRIKYLCEKMKRETDCTHGIIKETKYQSKEEYTMQEEQRFYFKNGVIENIGKLNYTNSTNVFEGVYFKIQNN